MTEVTILESAAHALAYGRAAVRANFKFDAPDDEEKNCIRLFNSQWNTIGQPLSSLLSEFLSACYRSDTHSAEELKTEPGLSITADVVNTWRKINTEVYPKFVSDYSGMTAKLFSNPEVEADMSGPNKKSARAKQLTTFNKIQEQAVEKFQQLEDFIMYQVQLRFDNFKMKVKGMELSRLLRQGQAPYPTPDQPSTQPAPPDCQIDSFDQFGRRLI